MGNSGRSGDKEAAALIPAIYLLKTVFEAVSNTIRAPFTPIIFEKRQKSLRLISRLINSTTGKRKHICFTF